LFNKTGRAVDFIKYKNSYFYSHHFARLNGWKPAKGFLCKCIICSRKCDSFGAHYCCAATSGVLLTSRTDSYRLAFCWPPID